MRRFVLVAACLIFHVTVVAAASDLIPNFTESDIDKLVSRAMDRFATPGIAVGIVKNGELIYAKGHGVRELDKPEPVDADTLFAIASNTKAFTTAALAILMDEGKIAWDDRVVDHMPKFQLSEPWVTREFTIRDLLTHRSGLRLGAGDLMVFPDTDFTRNEIISRLKFLEMATSFRSAFAYDNQLYIVAGELIPAVTGMSWEDFVESRILAPLEMEPCAVKRSRVKGTDNIASSHAVIEGSLQIVEPDETSVIAAGGGIVCSVSGMARWVKLQLSAGKVSDDKSLFSEDRHREMWSPQTILPLSNPLFFEKPYEWDRTHFAAYGLGWVLNDFDGYKRVWHTGGLLGQVSLVSLLPELELGVIVLTNQQSVAMFAIASQITKAYTGAEKKDWIEVFSQYMKEREEKAASEVSEAREKRSASSTPSLPLSAYAGTYRDAWRGDATITEKGGKLTLRFSRTERMAGEMEHFNHDVFIVRWEDRSLEADAYVKFQLGFEGEIENMTMKAVSPMTDFSFDFQDLLFERVE
jgi:CubicO group peptidase (beta-lactamase class C family)